MKRIFIATTGLWLCPLFAQLGGLPKQKGPRVNGPARESQEKKAFERLRSMPAQRRSEALAKLPPKRREELERKLREYDKLSPSERRAVHNGLDLFNQLPPEHRIRVRRGFNTLPETRRPIVRAEFLRMRNLSEPERRARMNSDEFRNRYAPQERALIADLAAALPKE